METDWSEAEIYDRAVKIWIIRNLNDFDFCSMKSLGTLLLLLLLSSSFYLAFLLQGGAHATARQRKRRANHQKHRLWRLLTANLDRFRNTSSFLNRYETCQLLRQHFQG